MQHAADEAVWLWEHFVSAQVNRAQCHWWIEKHCCSVITPTWQPTNRKQDRMWCGFAVSKTLNTCSEMQVTKCLQTHTLSCVSVLKGMWVQNVSSLSGAARRWASSKSLTHVQVRTHNWFVKWFIATVSGKSESLFIHCQDTRTGWSSVTFMTLLGIWRRTVATSSAKYYNIHTQKQHTLNYNLFSQPTRCQPTRNPQEVQVYCCDNCLLF